MWPPCREEHNETRTSGNVQRNPSSLDYYSGAEVENVRIRESIEANPESGIAGRRR